MIVQWFIIQRALAGAWHWLQQHALWILLFGVGAFTGAKLLRRKDSEVGTLKEALAVEQHKKAIEGLRARREEILSRDAESLARDAVLTQTAESIQAQIAERKRAVVELHRKSTNVHELTDEQVEELFRHAGL